MVGLGEGSYDVAFLLVTVNALQEIDLSLNPELLQSP